MRLRAMLAGVALIACAASAQTIPPLTVSNVDALRDKDPSAAAQPTVMTLTPAKWIWMPCARTLPNTFVLFRKEIDLAEAPVRARAWLTADSRYQLTVNGQRAQWGPAPCDPRQLDVDPCDLMSLLHAGKNVIGAEVLFYGFGDGTWPAGKPGFIFHATLEYKDGHTETIVSDQSWLTLVDRAHKPGQYKRWYLRSLQEDFDARLHPFGWDTTDFQPNMSDGAWANAAEINCAPDKPAACGLHESNDTIDRANPEKSALRARQIPAVVEETIPVAQLAQSGTVAWHRDPNDWFDMQIANAFDIARADIAKSRDNGWELPATQNPNEGLFATFELKDQVVGWPYFTIDAPAGTIIELMTQEGHDVKDGPLWLDTHMHSWARFACREGLNEFRTFDYESARWIQLHIRNATRPVFIRNVGVVRRLYPWPKSPHIVCNDPALQRLFDASVNTTYNSAIETYVDGMGRERQQYSADGGVQVFLPRYALGDNLLARRYLRTFSEGQSPDGYFMDCWPAFDRLARVSQKQIDGAYWGPLLDHAISFNFDCWWHYLYSGDLDGLKEPYPRLLKFADYLEKMRGADGLLPVENLGIPTVWIDHDAYKQNRHKQCAYNLFAAAMFKHALAPLCRAMNDADKASHFEQLSDSLVRATVARYWNEERGRFEANLPWQKEEGEVRLCDRSLATSLLFDQCPDNLTVAALDALADAPPIMGISYPANAYWRYWALSKYGRTDVVVKDWRERWATMPSVLLNNTLGEWWTQKPDSGNLWSHCPVSPVYVLFMNIAGIMPASPGFATCTIRPQLAGLGDLEVTAYTAKGDIPFKATREESGHQVTVGIPKDMDAELLLNADAKCALEALMPDTPQGLKRYRLKSGASNTFYVP